MESRKKDLLTLAELSPEELNYLLDLADNFKKQRKRKPRNCFSDLGQFSVALIFEKPSTRTRVSFEVGINELGGTAVYLNSNDLHLSRGESIEDTAKVLSRYVDIIGARVYSHSDIEELAAFSDVPVINLLSDLYHPCQILADLQTIREVKGRLQGLKIAWVGDGNNVCNSLLIGCALSDISISVASPRNYQPHPFAIQEARKILFSSSVRRTGSIDILEEPLKAVQDSDVVVTDTFISMGFEVEKDKRFSTFLPKYRVTKELMTHAKPDAIFMHCLPAHRGEEVTPEVIDGTQSVIFQEAENRLYTQKALIHYMLSQGRISAELVRSIKRPSRGS
jgi:ornithine carbamoyltransferase